jgi:probable F420-dependent oxidoreductase
MRFGVMFANVGPFTRPGLLETLARAVDEVGFESLWTVEQVVAAAGEPATVPVSDPLLPLAYAASITKRVRLGTAVAILPQHHPLQIAKAIATLDVLSNGRALFGVGIGWVDQEFEALGIPAKERSARIGEAIMAIRASWQDSAEAFDGKFYRWTGVTSLPKPVQRPGVPIIVGGLAEGGARRAALYGDGFFPAGDDPGDIAWLIGEMHSECRRVGRDPTTIELTAAASVHDVDHIRRLQDLGITRVMIAPPGFDEMSLRRGLTEFAEHVMAKV